MFLEPTESPSHTTDMAHARHSEARRWRWILGLLLVGLVWGSPRLAGAETEDDAHDWFAGVGGDVWIGEVTGGHGYLLVHWRWHGLGPSSRLDLSLSTDTLEASLSGLELSDHLSAHASLKGEYPFGRLLPDYYRRGRRWPGREFNAGYLRAEVGLQASDGDAHFVDLTLRGRKWWFRRLERTSDALQLPEDLWAFEPRLSYTYWNVRSDRSQWQPHHPFTRIRGLAVGARVGADWRSSSRAWGARGPPFSPIDPRNEPETPILTVRQWLEIGWPLSTPVYLRLAESAAWGSGEDDLTRSRLGGLNPWVAPVAGLPWGSIVSGRYLTGRLGLRWTGWADHEFGIFVDGGGIADLRRTGALDTLDPAMGFGALADLRFGDWKADARIGWAYPFDWLQSRPMLSFWVSTGRTW